MFKVIWNYYNIKDKSNQTTNPPVIVSLLCVTVHREHLYSGCQKSVSVAERFFATTPMPPFFFRNINMTSGVKTN
jgi:hypothetical protein